MCQGARRPARQGAQNVLAGAAPPIHLAAAIRCQVQSGAGGPTPSRQKSSPQGCSTSPAAKSLDPNHHTTVVVVRV
jgi:hypothetical protein